MVSKGEVEFGSLIRKNSTLDAKQTLQLAQQLKAKTISSVSQIDSVENEAKAISFKIDSKNVDFANHTSITFISENMFTEEDLTSDCNAFMNATLKPSQLIGPRFTKEGRRGRRSQNHILKLFPDSNAAHNKKIVYERKLRKIDHREIKSTAVRQPLAQSNTRKYRSRNKISYIEAANRAELINLEQYLSLINGKSGAVVQENENSDPLLTFEQNVASPFADVLVAGNNAAVFDPDTIVCVETVNPQPCPVKGTVSSESTSSIKEDNSEHPGQLCRLCATSGDAMIYIFGEVGVELDLRKKINSWLPTRVSRSDPLPKQVCSKCIQKLLQCHEFVKSCAEAEKKLNNLVKNKKFSCQTEGVLESDGISLEEPEQETEKSEKYISSVQDLDNSNCSVVENEDANIVKGTLWTEAEKNEIFFSEDSSVDEVMDTVKDDASNPNKYDCPLCCEGNMHAVQKKTASTFQVPEAVCNNSGVEEIVDEQLHGYAVDVTNIKIEAKVKKSTVTRLDGAPGTKRDYNSISEAGSAGEETVDFGQIKTEYEIPEKKVRVVFENNDPIIQDNGPVACWVCGELLESLYDCMAHGLQAHGDTEEGIYPCSQCEESFCTSEDMSHHFSTSHFPTLRQPKPRGGTAPAIDMELMMRVISS